MNARGYGSFGLLDSVIAALPEDDPQLVLGKRRHLSSAHVRWNVPNGPACLKECEIGGDRLAAALAKYLDDDDWPVRETQTPREVIERIESDVTYTVTLQDWS